MALKTKFNWLLIIELGCGMFAIGAAVVTFYTDAAWIYVALGWNGAYLARIWR